MRGRASRWALVALVPVLVAASDPAGDVRDCGGGDATGAPDLVEARGEIVELGTSARWTLTFAEPLTVPDPEGHPFRVDVAVRDPDVPAVSFRYFRDINRLVRVDATVDHRTEIYLLPERATNEFNPPIVTGRTMVIQVPGRILSADEDLTGTSPGLDRLRWTVVVRDGRACDVLGDGTTTQRFVVAPPERTASPPAQDNPSAIWLVTIAAIAAAAAVTGYVLRRAR